MAELKLPPLTIEHPAKPKNIRNFWDRHCSKILAESKLPETERVNIVLKWWEKAGVRDFMLGKMVSGWSRPKPTPATEEKKKERNQSTLKRLTYNTEVPYLRALHEVVGDRLENLPGDTAASLAVLDAREGDPATAFTAFSQSVDQKVLLEYKAPDTGGIVDAAA